MKKSVLTVFLFAVMVSITAEAARRYPSVTWDWLSNNSNPAHCQLLADQLGYQYYQLVPHSRGGLDCYGGWAN